MAKKKIPIDPNGYYNPANQGKPVIIPSNQITMKGLTQHVLGISNTGDKKIMKPGKDYKFKGSSVMEFPIAQAGGTQPTTRKPAKKKAYNIDDEIPTVLGSTSPYDGDSTFSEVVVRAAKRGEIDPKLLFSSSLQEGLNRAAVRPDEVSEAYNTAYKKDKKLDEFPVDGFYNYGLDRFDEMYPELQKKGYLPKDFQYRPFVATNEKNEPIKTAAFHNNEDALVAKSAVLKNERDKVRTYLKKKNLTIPVEAEDYFLLASYNGGFGNAQKMIDEYATVGGDVQDFIVSGRTTRQGVHKNILPRYQRIAKMTEYGLKAGGKIPKKKAQAGLTAADQEINAQFIKENTNIFQPISPVSDDVINQQFQQEQQPIAQPQAAGQLPPAPPKPKKKEPYTGVNPFIATLTGINAILGKQPTPRLYTRPEDTPYYNPYPSGTGSQAIMQGGGQLPDKQGGDLKIHDQKSKVNFLSNNFTSNPIMEFKGDGHEDGGIPISFQGQKVEVEGDETAFQDLEGNLQILGNMKNPLTGRLFKNDGKKIAQIENKADNQIGRALSLVNEKDPTDPFERLSFNSGKLKLEGGKQKLDKATAAKENLAAIQSQMLQTAHENNLNPIKMSKKAKYGKVMEAQAGYSAAYDFRKPPVQPIAPVQPIIPIQPVIPEGSGPLTRRGVARGSTPVANPRAGAPRANRPIAAPVPVASQPAPLPLQTLSPPTRDMSMKVAVSPSAGKIAPLNVPVVRDSLNYTPRQPIETDAQGMDPRNIYPELYAIGTNRVEAVQMQRYQPELEQAFNYSLQDQVNQNTSTFRAAQAAANGSPESLSVLAGQNYQANSGVLANEFRINQEQSAGVYNRNRNTMNQAQMTNLGLQDQQYVRQEQAKSNTRRMNLDILSSLASKGLQHTRDMNELQVYENLYDYRFGDNYRAEYKGPDFVPNIPQVGGTNPATGRPYTQREIQYYLDTQQQTVKGPPGVTNQTTQRRSNTPIRRGGKAGMSIVKAYKSLNY